MSNSVSDAVFHYKRSLEKRLPDEKIISALIKLQKIPVTIQILKDSGIGKTVKPFKKRDGKIGSEANKLIKRWKELIDQPVEAKPRYAEKASKEGHGSGTSSSTRDKDNTQKSSSPKKEYISSRDKDNTQKSSSQKKENKHTNISSSKADGMKNSSSSFQDCLVTNDTAKSKKRKAPSLNSSPSKSSHSRDEPSSSSQRPEHQPDKKRQKSNGCLDLPEELKQPILPPIDSVDILSTLPDIQPTYKPLPNKDLFSPQHSQTRDYSEADLDQFSTKRTLRMALYSGKKNSFTTTVPSLREICIEFLIANITELSETGGVPYVVLKPVLEKCTAKQLDYIESCNPYLLEDTDELWQIHCERDFKNSKPEPCESWKDLHFNAIFERENKLHLVMKNIKKSMAKATPLRKVKTTYMDEKAFIKPPRDVARKQAKHGTASSANCKPPGKGGPRHSFSAPEPSRAAAKRRSF